MPSNQRVFVDFIDRPNLIFIRDTFEDLSFFKPENAVLVLSQSDTVFDVGSLCYRLTKSKSGSSIRLVCQNSLDIARRSAVTKLIEFFKAKDSKSSDKSILNAIRQFQLWIDKQSFSINFDDPGSVKNSYIQYTSHLIYRKNLLKGRPKKIKALTNNSASALQKRARIWCHCITQIPLSEIEFWAPRILFNDRQKSVPNSNPITLDDCNKTCSALLKIIDDAWSGLIKGKQDYFRVGSVWIDLNEKEESRRVFLARVTSYAAMSLIAVTGANKEVACKLELGKGSYSATTKGMKFSGLKARANNRTVYLEFGAKYLRYWRKYLELRELMLEGAYSKYAFPYRTQDDTLRSMPPARLDRDEGHRSKPAHFFEKASGERWISARGWRPSRELRINQINDGDIIETAELQSHTVQVALKHYLSVDLTTAAAEISNALNSVYEAAIKRTRSRESIAVEIVDNYNKNAVIPTGQCTSEGQLNPNLAPGFTNKNQVPDCRIKETCIFCEHYGVHADEEDLRRLLSLRFLCNELKQSMGHDQYVGKWGPVTFRVDEIINKILEKNITLKACYDAIKKEVDMGYLDKFWEARLETLMAVGVIS